MNTFEDAFRVVIEKHMGRKNRKMESSVLHPLNLIKMIKNKEESKKVANNKAGVSGLMNNQSRYFE